MSYSLHVMFCRLYNSKNARKRGKTPKNVKVFFVHDFGIQDEKHLKFNAKLRDRHHVQLLFFLNKNTSAEKGVHGRLHPLLR